MYEVFKRVLQEFGEERALDAMEIMSLGIIIDLDRQIAIHAAQISNELKLAMADSIALSLQQHALMTQSCGLRMSILKVLKA